MVPPGDRVLLAGRPVDLRLEASDPEGATVAFGARGLPTGSRLVPEPGNGTAVFQWIPLASDADPGGRPHLITFIAQDPQGSRAEARVTLTVYSDQTRPRFTSPRAFVLSPGESLDVLLTVTDDDSTTLNYELVSAPAGASLDARSDGARLTWTAPRPETAGSAPAQSVFAFVVAVEDETGVTGRVVQTFHALVEPPRSLLP